MTIKNVEFFENSKPPWKLFSSRFTEFRVILEPNFLKNNIWNHDEISDKTLFGTTNSLTSHLIWNNKSSWKNSYFIYFLLLSKFDITNISINQKINIWHWPQKLLKSSGKYASTWLIHCFILVSHLVMDFRDEVS